MSVDHELAPEPPERDLAPETPTRGVALPAAIAATYGALYGHDFSAVRVHADAAAEVGPRAQAVTRGHDIFFAPGRYAPHTIEGQRLLAHELAHVAQQGPGTAAATTAGAPGGVQQQTHGAQAPVQSAPVPASAPTPPTPQELADEAGNNVRDAVRAAAAPLVGTTDATDLVDRLTRQIIKRRTHRRPRAGDPRQPLHDTLYGTAVTADLTTIDTELRNPRNRRDKSAANAVRRRVLQEILDGLVTDARPHTAVAAPGAAVDRAQQIAAERTLVPHVLSMIDSGRTWDDVRLGIITEFGGLVAGTRTALARADAYFTALQPASFRNVTRNTKVHPDLNAAFARADTWLTAQLTALPVAQRTATTDAIRTVLGRSTWAANVRENRNATHRLSDHSFGFAIDIDSPRNPNISRRGGLDAVADVTGVNPRPGTTVGRTAAQVTTTARSLRAASDAYVAAMTDDASLAPVLLRLANAARAAARPALPALPSGDPLVAALVLTRERPRAAALRTAVWPEASTPVAGAHPPAPPAPITAVEEALERIGTAYRATFRNVRTRTATGHVRATSEGTRGSVAAHGFLNLPPLLVAALTGSDAGNLKWLGTANQDFMHFELNPRPPLFTTGTGAVADPSPPPDPGAVPTTGDTVSATGGIGSTPAAVPADPDHGAGAP
ncbi:DUF4157 domain-containing protein [Isoptericola sp. 178]|uniref:eCIS core domain-containing protein n=1 Tax=Isoptericola sp. 178 TaxID=3064651 RepID=UPI002712A8BD|nr:DUF4157 domain-containing protein [Isoptericola sp. 178]MDO8144910.1 DUF4157 domain-containing protein [Isoptericola sp. 178]